MEGALVDGVALAKGTEDFGSIEGDVILDKGGGDCRRSIWVWNDEAIKVGGPWGIKQPAITRMHTTIAPVRGLSHHTVVECRGWHRACSGRIGDMAVTSSRTGDSGDVHFINQTLWADPVSVHALVEETESGAYIRRGVAIGDSALVGSGKDGGCLGDCKLLGCFFFFLPIFFFFFCCCCFEEVEVSGSDGSVKSGIGDLDDLGLLGEDSSIVVDVLKSLIPNLQRFRPWINESWSWHWAFQVEDSVSVAEVTDVAPPGGSKVACPWRVILLVRGVVLLTAELWGDGDSGQVL